jgi:hypothetical protein
MRANEWEGNVVYRIKIYIFFIGTDELFVAPIIDAFSKMPVIELRTAGIVS